MRIIVRACIAIAGLLLRAASRWSHLEPVDRSSLRWFATRAGLIGRFSGIRRPPR